MEYSWIRREIDMILECGNRYVLSDIAIYLNEEVLGSVMESKQGYQFVFLSPFQAGAHGIQGMSYGISPFGGGSQSFSFPKECASSDKEIGEFTIQLLKAGRKRFMSAVA